MTISVSNMTVLGAAGCCSVNAPGSQGMGQPNYTVADTLG
jgi:hypothetical protein